MANLINNLKRLVNKTVRIVDTTNPTCPFEVVMTVERYIIPFNGRSVYFLEGSPGGRYVCIWPETEITIDCD